MKSLLLTFLAIITAQLFLAQSVTIADDHKSTPKIKVLLVDGQNNHDWKRCSPVMIDTLDATGRFQIDRATVSKADVANFNPDFEKYDVLSNYNGAAWKRKQRSPSSNTSRVEATLS